MLASALFLLSNAGFAKDKGYYLPIAGYTILWKESLSNNLQGLQAGGLGYAFSNDFRVECVGLGYLEKITQWVIQQPTKSAMISPEDSQSSTSININELFSDNPPLDRLRPTTPLKSNLNKFGLNSSPDDLENPWASPKPNITAFNSTSLSSDVHSTTHDQGTQTALPEIPFEEVTEIQQEEITPVHWTGIALINIWTLLHLHPQFRVYWGPGITFLYPHHEDMKTSSFITFGVGAYWRLGQKWSIDCFGGKKMFNLLKGTSDINTSVPQKGLMFFNVSLNWLF